MPDNRKPLIYGAFPVCRNYTVRAYFCHHGPLQRRGCEDPVQYAGPLQRRVHPRHLYPHHQRDAEGCGGEDRRLHGDGHSQAGPRAARPAGGEPVQGDPVREGRVIEKAKALANIGKRLCFLITHVTQGEYRGLLFLSNFVQGQKNHSTRQFLKRIQLFWITRPDNPYQAF